MGRIEQYDAMRTCPECGKRYENEQGFCEVDGALLSGPDDALALAPQPNVGRVLGSYRVLQLIGEGGMGRVYLAEHMKLGRKVALKLLRPEYARHALAVKRFFGEARAVNQISHENIVEITDFIEEGEEKYYIMELLRGRSLSEVMRSEGALPLSRSLPIVMQVCSALAMVHEAGIVHRDLKPDNIFITERGGKPDFVKLLDFGVAKLTDRTSEEMMSGNKTGQHALVGTPEYMSPEQMSGKAVDQRADVYALGIILYEVVTGRQPFTAKSLGEMAIKHLTVTPVRPIRLKNLPHPIPRELDQLIMHCLQKDPLRRPANMNEIVARLTPLLPRVGDPEALRAHERRRGAQRVAIGALAAGATIVVGVVALESLRSRANGKSHDRGGATLAALSGRVGESQPPRRVVVSVDSKPQGARVFREGSSTPLGVTPFSAELPAGGTVEVLEFELEEHQRLRQAISLREDTRIAPALSRESLLPLEPPPKARAKPASRREDGAATAATPAPAPAPKTAPEPKTTPEPTPEPDDRGTIDPFAN